MGIRHRVRLNASRKNGFVLTVSARALNVAARNSFGGLPHHLGTNPQRMRTRSRLPSRSVTTSIGSVGQGMRNFFAKAMQAKANKGKPETIDANMLQAVSIAEKIAPYKHARLSAVKLAGDPSNPARFKDDASADELRAELMKRQSWTWRRKVDRTCGSSVWAT